ncbi:hypothetical protein BH20ACT2_BH20ACT2_06910 [soil metagenome]
MPPVSRTISTVDELVEALTARGGLDDGIDPLAHHLQCAHNLAEAVPDDLELQVAGLVHDLGSGLVPGDIAGHGRNGADAVRELLGRRVADLVELHVPAKRYLVSTDRAYGRRLSAGSTATLVRQGGTMTAAEITAFERQPEIDGALALRRADEAAKTPGRAVPDLARWRPVLDAVAERHR